MKKFLYLFSLIVAANLIFGCASTLPKTDQIQSTDNISEAKKDFISNDSLSKEIQTPVQEHSEITIDNAETAKDSLLPIPPQTDTLSIELDSSAIKKIDPFIDIQKIAAESFAAIKKFQSEGNLDSAILLLENFLLLDSLWKSWMNLIENQLKNPNSTLEIQVQADSLSFKTNLSETKKLNPFTDIQNIVAESFAHVKTLQTEKKQDSAYLFLENFSMLNTLWKSWMTHINERLITLKKLSEEEAAKFNNLTLAIINEMATSGDYQTIKCLADSLVSMAPGDSLIKFAKEKTELAFSKTFKKVQNEMEKIKEAAKTEGNYQKADSLAKRLKMRYRDFTDTLKLDAFISSLQNIASLQAENKNFWKNQNPETFLAKAIELGKNGNIHEAVKIFNLLLSSKIREKTIQEKNKIGKEFCQKVRSNAAKAYSQALNEKNTVSKKTSLETAQTNLINCLEYFPELPDALKAKQDLELLKEELK